MNGGRSASAADLNVDQRIRCIHNNRVTSDNIDSLCQGHVGIFTESLGAAMKFAHHVHSGNIHVNWGPMWRADLMPYGGLKESGLGREGPRYAVEEMTEAKTVVIHGIE